MVPVGLVPVATSPAGEGEREKAEDALPKVRSSEKIRVILVVAGAG
jgi:hypothetical protein